MDGDQLEDQLAVVSTYVIFIFHPSDPLYKSTMTTRRRAPSRKAAEAAEGSAKQRKRKGSMLTESENTKRRAGSSWQQPKSTDPVDSGTPVSSPVKAAEAAEHVVKQRKRKGSMLTEPENTKRRASSSWQQPKFTDPVDSGAPESVPVATESHKFEVRDYPSVGLQLTEQNDSVTDASRPRLTVSQIPCVPASAAAEISRDVV